MRLGTKSPEGLIAGSVRSYVPRTMFRRSETQQQYGDEGMLLRVYQQGFNARRRGLQRTPPAGYEGLILSLIHI